MTTQSSHTARLDSFRFFTDVYCSSFEFSSVDIKLKHFELYFLMFVLPPSLSHWERDSMVTDDENTLCGVYWTIRELWRDSDVKKVSAAARVEVAIRIWSWSWARAEVFFGVFAASNEVKRRRESPTVKKVIKNVLRGKDDGWLLMTEKRNSVRAEGKSATSRKDSCPFQFFKLPFEFNSWKVVKDSS